ncbi:MAG: prepilin-type N-terminal cleavage/methylation domain-containing protein [Polyangiaceae bacterium]|jgi:type II secretory pathway pseudopilin PulG
MSSTKRKLPVANQRAYTAVEVMLSIIVLGIGAAGVMTMQQASVQGNADAHMLDIGNSIAREWIERLRRDAVTWTMPDDSNPSPNWSTNTFLISQIGSATNAGKWIWATVPTAGPNTGSSDWGYGRSFDILGRDLPNPPATWAAQPATTFCANVRGDWLVQDQIIRAEVRVYWPRQMFAAPSAALCSGSETPDALGTGGGTQAYHFIYAATAIARNSAQ